MIGRLVSVLLVLAALPVGAESPRQADMAARIEALGRHDTATTSHEMHLDGCKMQIVFREDWGSHPKALHSVHHIDLTEYWPLSDRPEQDKRGWFALGTTTEVLMISMRPPARLASELAMRSDPTPPYRPSDRQDLDTFVIRDRLFHGLRFDDLPEPGRMGVLAALIDDYHLEFCRLAG